MLLPTLLFHLFPFFFSFFFFSIFFSSLCLLPLAAPLRSVLCRLGRAVPGLCCPPAAARLRPGDGHTDGASAAPLLAAQPRRPARFWIKSTVALVPLQHPHEGKCQGGSAQRSGTMTQSTSAGLALVCLHPAGSGGAILPPCPPSAPKGCPGTAETLGSFPAHC